MAVRARRLPCAERGGLADVIADAGGAGYRFVTTPQGLPVLANDLEAQANPATNWSVEASPWLASARSLASSGVFDARFDGPGS